MNANNNTNTITATSGSLNQPKQYFNLAEEITKDLADNNIELSSNDYFHWTMAGNNIKLETLTNFLWCYRIKMNLKAISKEQILNLLSDMEFKIKNTILDKFKASIKYNPLAKDTFEELARFVTKENYHPMYPVVLKHIVWTTKRRLYDMPVFNPIFLNVYGAAGSGKSQFVKAFFSIFPHTIKSSVTNAGELFSDERQMFRFEESYVIRMDELTGLNKTDMNKLKNAIDSEILTWRILCTNKKESCKNNAQLIGTSNTRLQNTLYADSDIRKWCELDMYKYPDKEVSEKMVKPLIAYDWLNLWQSVNENEASPFENPDTYNSYRIWTQNKCLTETPTVEFIKDYITANGGKFVPINEIYLLYTATVHDKPMSKSKLKELLEKNSFTYKRRNSGIGYLVPTEKQCQYFTSEENQSDVDSLMTN